MKDICREFCYNEEWIRNGTPPEKPLDKLSTYLGQIDKGNDEFIKDLIVAYMELDPDSKKSIANINTKNVSGAQQKRAIPPLLLIFKKYFYKRIDL